MAVKEKKRVQVQIDKELADNTEAVLSITCIIILKSL